MRLANDFALEGIEPVVTGAGICFGLDGDGGEHVFAAVRNLDAEHHIIDARFGVNRILTFRAAELGAGVPPAAALEFGRGADLHQIRWHDGLLWVVTPPEPNLHAVNPFTGEVVGSVSLHRHVPPDLRHGADPDHPHDLYHFNSIEFPGRRRAIVLAHNWDFGAFAMELEFRTPRSLLRGLFRTTVHRGLGQQSHDLRVEGDELWTLDSCGGAMMSSGGRRAPISLAGERPPFLRGMAEVDGRLLVGACEPNHERADRHRSRTRLVVCDAASKTQRGVIDLGRLGDVCDMLVLPGGAV